MLNNVIKINIAIFIIFFFIPKGIAIMWFNILSLLTLTSYKYYKHQYKKFIIFKDKLFILLMIMIFIEFISGLSSEYMHNHIYQWRKDYIQMLMFSMLLLLNYKLIDHKFIYKVFVISLFVVGIYNFYELYQYNLTLDIFNEDFQSIRDLSFVVPILFPVVIYGTAVFRLDKFFLLLSVLSILLSFIIIVYSGSRGAMISFAIELFIFYLYLIVIFIKNSHYTKVFYLLSVLTFFVIYIFTSNNAIVQNTINRGFDSNTRMQIYQDIFPIISNNVFTGIGKGELNESQSLKFYNIQNQEIYIDNNNFLLGSHNRYLELMRNSGIFALILYILVLYIFVRKYIILRGRGIFDIQNLFILSFVTIIVDHFIVRGLVETLKFERFYFIMFLFINLYYNFNDAENSVHLPRKITSKEC